MGAPDASLGATLRVWRDRLAPEQVGLASDSTRRAVGLRREELADLADISVDYLVRLEQGRATSPSVQVVAALARALQLTAEERSHLYRLAGLRAPEGRLVDDRISPGVRRLLARLGDVAVGVFTADWRLVSWNPAWAALLGDPGGIAPADRNFALERFPIPDSAARIASWPVRSDDAEATDWAVVSDLRRASGRYPDDPGLVDLLERLMDGNRRFAELWRAGAVTEHAEDQKTVEHPAVGEIVVDCDVLHAGDTDLKIVVLTATPETDDRNKIELARITALSEVR